MSGNVHKRAARAHLIGQAEVEVLHQRGHGGHQADLGQGLPHAAAGALREGEVALGPLAVFCMGNMGCHNVSAQAC